MTGEVLNIDDIIVPDQLGTFIANRWLTWDNMRHDKKMEWKEAQAYLFATDTTKTSNAKLPWSNKTTVPKLSQIRDNLFANYTASMFPKRQFVEWEADNRQDQDQVKQTTIQDYINFTIENAEVQNELQKLVLDFVDYGNAFAMVEWVDETTLDTGSGKRQAGYVGPSPRRISPLDIVFNPLAPSFKNSPKIIRSIISIGEVKEMLERQSGSPEDLERARELWAYLLDVRQQVAAHGGDLEVRDETFQISGFDSYRNYLDSDTVEVLTFYGDVFDRETETLLKNHVITVVDRHKVIQKIPNPSHFGTPNIWHVGWRIRQDNLWAMGPLDNLVGMQYRIDHLENLKADIFDLTAYPLLKISGYVEDFEWEPFGRIYVGDDGDVDIIHPDVQALQANFEIQTLEDKMEAMAGAPKEALGFRSPGEKTAFEVQRLENASSRIFQSKIAYFERQMTEPLLNGMLEMAKRNLTEQSIRVFDEELKIVTFSELTVDDITGSGRIRPKAAQHFAEKATQLQNLTNLLSSSLGSDPAVNVHMSGLRLAQLAEDLLELRPTEIVQPYIRIAEQADAQRHAAAAQEQVEEEVATPSGLFPDDFDDDVIEEEAEAQLEAQERANEEQGVEDLGAGGLA